MAAAAPVEGGAPVFGALVAIVALGIARCADSLAVEVVLIDEAVAVVVDAVVADGEIIDDDLATVLRFAVDGGWCDGWGHLWGDLGGRVELGGRLGRIVDDDVAARVLVVAAADEGDGDDDEDDNVLGRGQHGISSVLADCS